MIRTYIKDSRIIKLENEILNGNSEALEKFFDDLKEQGSPLIESIANDNTNDLVTLIYRGNSKTKNVVLIPPVGMRKLENHIMDRLLDTNLFYISYIVKKDVRFSYHFSPNDPLNNDWERRWKNAENDIFNNKHINLSGKISGKYNLVSYVEMSEVTPDIYTVEKSDLRKGTLHEHAIYSSILEEERSFNIYLPNSYNDNKDAYGMLVLNDGFEYINILKAQNVLDNLINQDIIEPIIGVFIDSTDDRAENLQCSDKFTDFISKELIPYIKKEYNISNDSSKNIIGGYSLGGLAASYIGFKCSNIFGNVLSQSGSYWYKRKDYSDANLWINTLFNSSNKLNLKFYINVGSIEPKVTMIDTNINFKENLIRLGYDVYFEEFGSGHDYLYWGETLAKGLISLVGNKSF